MSNNEAILDPTVTIESEEFRMDSGRFAMEMVYRFAAPWLLILSICAVLGIVLGITVDLRLLIVALMVVFVVSPMLLAFLYYYFGLRRESYINTLPHSVVTAPEGITVRLYLGEDREVHEEFFPYSNMLPIKTGLKSVTVELEKPSKGFIWLPLSAFKEDDRFVEAIRIIDCRIHLAKGLPSPLDNILTNS